MTSLLITNNSYTKIPTIKEADFHSNIGKSGENCNYGSNSSWKGEPPSEGFVYPKVTLYSYEDIEKYIDFISSLVSFASC